MNILVTGGAGYVGSLLVPELLRNGHEVIVYDLFLYGKKLQEQPGLTLCTGDIRDYRKLVAQSRGADAIIHLASISNHPSYELNPELGKSINYDAIYNVVEAARGAERLIFASSASVYGVQNDSDVTEYTEPNPQTDYAKYKLEAERIFLDAGLDCATMVRFATICGYAPRLRLDLVVNIFASHALINNRIKVFGGRQFRPNIHIRDVVRSYMVLLEAPPRDIDGKIYNVGSKNMSLNEIAYMVQSVIPGVQREDVSTDDNRSYYMNSDLITKELCFVPKCTIEDAIRGLAHAYREGLIVDGLNNPQYHNVKLMKEVDLK